jgi:hypothetical protein
MRIGSGQYFCVAMRARGAKTRDALGNIAAPVRPSASNGPLLHRLPDSNECFHAPLRDRML